MGILRKNMKIKPKFKKNLASCWEPNVKTPFPSSIHIKTFVDT